MSETLVVKDTVQRVGYTVIDGVKVIQHTCILPIDAPTEMRITMTKLNADLYKENRDICRKDFAEFEDACFKLQESYLGE